MTATIANVRHREVEGHWTVTALGAGARRQHFAPLGAETWRDVDGYPMGLIAGCGRHSIAASAKYRQGIPVCEDCKHLFRRPVEHRC